MTTGLHYEFCLDIKSDHANQMWPENVQHLTNTQALYCIYIDITLYDSMTFYEPQQYS